MRVQAAIAGWRFEAPRYLGRPVVLRTYAQVDVRGRTDDAGTAQFEVQFVSSGAVRRPESVSHLRYPPFALRNRRQGLVTVRAWIGADGAVERTEVERSSGDGSLDRAASTAVAKWTFLTETADGVGLPNELVLPIEFRLVADAATYLVHPSSGIGRTAAFRAFTRRL